MLCIELTRNGKRLATAGVKRGGVSVSLGGPVSRGQPPAGDGWEVYVGGWEEASTKGVWSLDWLRRPLRAEDVIIVRVLECTAPDEPRRRRRVLTDNGRRAKERRLLWYKRQASKLRKELTA